MNIELCIILLKPSKETSTFRERRICYDYSIFSYEVAIMFKRAVFSSLLYFFILSVICINISSITIIIICCDELLYSKVFKVVLPKFYIVATSVIITTTIYNFIFKSVGVYKSTFINIFYTFIKRIKFIMCCSF